MSLRDTESKRLQCDCDCHDFVWRNLRGMFAGTHRCFHDFLETKIKKRGKESSTWLMDADRLSYA